MAKKKKISPRAAQACKDLLAEGATKKYLACSLDMCPSTLTKRRMSTRTNSFATKMRPSTQKMSVSSVVHLVSSILVRNASGNKHNSRHRPLCGAVIFNPF